MHLSSGHSRSFYKGRYAKALISDINITPFVDVMLVLLIIFMVTAPLMTPGILISLPEVSAPSLHEKIEPLTLSLDAEGKIFLQETEMSLKDLPVKLLALKEVNAKPPIYIRASRSLEYGYVMQVISVLKETGFHHIALLTASPTPSLLSPVKK